MTEQNKAVEALLLTQQLLEQIVHHKSTCMDDVHKRIVANRAALSRPTQTADAVEAAAKRAYSVACRQRSLTMPWDGLSDNGKSEWLEVTRAALSHTATSEGVDEIISFIRQQAKIGAEWAKSSEKGTKRRAAYGGGSLALKRIADEIERGAYSNAECVGCGHYIGHLDYDVDDNGATGCEACFTQDGSGKCFTLTAPNTPENTATSEATPTPDSGLAGELAELQSKASDGPWSYRPEESDDWGFIRGPLRTVDWADYPVRPFVAQARHSDLQDDELHAQCRREKRDPYIDDAKLIVWLRNHVPEILTALQSNSDSELLREALLDAAVAFELYADNHTAKANLGPKSERAERTEKANRNAALGKQMRQALARLEQGAA